jgi:GNAT superfamily N-acetyltransferase
LEALYARVYGGRYPLAIDLTGAIGAVAEDGAEVVACMFGAVDSWNHSFELGRTVVLPEYRRAGLARTLSEHVLSQAEAAGAEIVWGYARSTAIVNVAKHKGMTAVGYFPGAHKVEDREVHLLVMRLSESARSRRVRPLSDAMYRLSGVRRVTRELKLGRLRSEYPRNVLVSSMSENVSIRGTYHDADRSLVLTETDTLGPIAPEYVQATVLTDKVEYIQRAFDRGFRITAFLPAWFEHGSTRCDAVLLTCALAAPEFYDPAFQSVVREFEDGFQRLEAPSDVSLPSLSSHLRSSARILIPREPTNPPREDDED